LLKHELNISEIIALKGKVWQLKVLGILCSARKGGNTEILVQDALAAAKERGADVEMISISDMKIAPCDGCMTCHQSGECRIKDDMQKIYKKVLAADGIILGSPVYFWSISGQAKIFMDRTYALRYPHHKLKNKVGGAIVATGRRGSVSALSVINNFFLGHDMLISGLGIAGYGTNKGQVRQDKHAIKSARSLGTQITELIKRTKPRA
jgi:multimeric flavodoxin WrbA